MASHSLTRIGFRTVAAMATVLLCSQAFAAPVTGSALWRHVMGSTDTTSRCADCDNPYPKPPVSDAEIACKDYPPPPV